MHIHFFYKFNLIIVILFFIVSCAKNPNKDLKFSRKYVNIYTQKKDGPVDPKDLPNLSMVKNIVPRYEPKSRYGNPNSYTVFNKTYKVLPSSIGYTESGYASWYGTKFHGFRTSSGEIYDMYKMTAAHKTLPLPTYAKVINLDNNRSIIVKINDRGPFHSNRVIDLSYVAAAKLGILKNGTGKVKVIAIDTTISPKLLAKNNRSNSNNIDNQNFIGNLTNNDKIQLGAFSVYDNAKKLATKLENLLNKNYEVNISSNSLQNGVKKNTLYKVILSSKKGELDLKYVNKIISNISKGDDFKI